MKSNIYDTKGKKTEVSITLDDAIWAVPVNTDLLAQAIRVYRHNQSKGTAHSKTRAEVEGGGKKPWKQKGTGRARQGSIRSPLWTKGGVTFGPRSYKRNMTLPKKMAVLAVKSALSDKVKQEKVFIFDKFEGAELKKTSGWTKALSAIEGVNRSKLLLFPTGADIVTRKAVSNLPKVEVKWARQVNVFEIMRAGALFISQDALKELETRLK